MQRCGLLCRWQSEQECFKAWEQAISLAGLDWKYRQVEDGEWDVLQNMVSADELCMDALLCAQSVFLQRPLGAAHVRAMRCACSAPQGDDRYRGQGAGGKGRVDRGVLAGGRALRRRC